MAEVAKASTFDEVGKFVWNFLKSELTPYPGRAWVVGRITIAATIIMVLVMTFRIPYGFLGCIYTLFLSRESPNATLLSGAKTILIARFLSGVRAFAPMFAGISRIPWRRFASFDERAEQFGGAGVCESECVCCAGG